MISDIVTTNKKDFKYWFKHVDNKEWKIYDQVSEFSSAIGTVVEKDIPEYSLEITLNSEDYESARQDINESFLNFTARPEYFVYDFMNCYTEFSDLKVTGKQIYEKLLVGCVFLRMERCGNDSPENLANKLDDMLDWINGTDFYYAPASTRFHGAYTYGLIEHTLNVVIQACNLFYLPIWKNKLYIEDIVLVALVHDWCKIVLYESYLKNVKNEDTGVWEKTEGYRIRETPMSCMGHGASSLFLAQKFFKLTTEEALAIRWHMGEYNVAANEMNDLHQANETYPMVQLIQFADRLSIVKY